MLFLLSPAKSLDFDTPAGAAPHTQPLFIPQAAELIDVLRQKSPQQIASLMSLSDTLAGLNVARYQAWTPKFTAKNAKQAVLAFNGDVYEGLDAKSLATDDLKWLQEHVCILSGLYGVLRPLDYMQPYRLEMGTKLATVQGKDLYQFWGAKISDYLNSRLHKEAAPVVVNLASQEYFKAVDRKALQARVVECVFQEQRNGQCKIISFYAKRARGLMARFAATHRLSHPKQLESFDSEGYAFDAGASEPDRLVFRRAQLEA
ncbi:MAG: peroxide stress protein YaaA [Gammaproteobacteria bacterium]|uniref:peroxide stress protein YaaA n=1 Tax=Rhodoferax sp. TaxID=50421 RepID=UPI0018224DE8|nr:peroxide stress protein YaaA [Rhodoferax sp.]MBU3899665.1 peroxide stress protein YaaA [Gammaproteobacteria bacterium]MBA3056370.1 peroxide stress protein YaaA [Rhodoferax sp.]MBU3997413.1 peroxide stress protein YaaA [Gammaproteobacteria bacterium]MBU4018141.1 peroxide stress protein YaaA [Gammaproteobacteria bacterium]MBU4080168.1 peroxide stress protein YaaA [Gammaproteobacteria bacterium]